VKYISTRGKCPAQNFEEVLLTGLAPDGGLYIPESIPQVSAEQLEQWKSLPYADLAYEIIKLYVEDCMPGGDLKRIINETYAVFSHDEVAPVRRLQDGEYVLELFHGPTLAFKDFALQLLGRLLDYFLERRKKKCRHIRGYFWRYRIGRAGGMSTLRVRGHVHPVSA